MAGKKRGAGRLRLIIQAVCLGLFVWLLSRAAWPLDTFPPPDLFLRLDPLLAVAAPLAAREWIWALVPGLIVPLVTVLAGRVFCGYVCPLGTTLDLGRWALRRFRQPAPPKPIARGWRSIKYWLLAAVVGAAFLGGNPAFWVAPIPVVTRLYAYALHPLALWGGDAALTHGQPLFEAFNWSGLGYAALAGREYGGAAVFTALFGLALVALELWRPRFWCRHLCPAGALLGLCSRRPAWRRRVSRCEGCGQCVRQCSAAAIAPDGRSADHAECLVCRDCVDRCPAAGVHFTRARPEASVAGEDAAAPSLSRRAFLSGAAAGLALAWVRTAGPPNLWGAGTAAWVRPPGALPETDFLARCARCGECLKACPTNGLQPAWPPDGWAGVLSPRLVPRRGGCEPDCQACGRVCPTGALRPLPPEEKAWAKIGTAEIQRETCLAWAEDRSCVVCQEVCPFGAMDLEPPAPGRSVPAPAVAAARCYGCGYCERHCPVTEPAVVVRPEGALRLAGGSYRAEAGARGLDLVPGRRDFGEFHLPEGQLPPGFLE